MTNVSYEEWKWQTTSMLELRVGASWTDLCGDDDVLYRSFQDGWSPGQFCEWFIRKFDLTELWEIGL